MRSSSTPWEFPIFRSTIQYRKLKQSPDAQAYVQGGQEQGGDNGTAGLLCLMNRERLGHRKRNRGGEDNQPRLSTRGSAHEDSTDGGTGESLRAALPLCSFTPIIFLAC